MKNTFTRLVTLVVFSLFVVSCGKAPSNVLTSVKVQTSTVGGDTWMSFSANLNLGSMSFAAISVPVILPNSQTPVGEVDLISSLGGVNLIKLSINVSAISSVRAGQAVLPNGNLIPLIANNPTIAINIGNGAKLYLTISESVTAVGVAVPIIAFDSIGQSLPGLNFFPVVYTDGVIGTAGVFTGKNPGQNGIAVVADVSQVVNLGKIIPASDMSIQSDLADSGISLDYSSQSGNSSQKFMLDSMISELNLKKAVLRMRR